MRREGDEEDGDESSASIPVAISRVYDLDYLFLLLGF